MSDAGVSAVPAQSSKGRNLLKTLPGLLISAGFLWYTFSKISFSDLRAMRLVHPVWIAGILAFTLTSYTLRCVRWTRMMRSTGARFGVCARVLMTSLAANNILPLRIGDIMRVFTYAGDLGASPSVILSTVILEKLLDIFILVLLFTSTMGSQAPPHSKSLAETLLAISTIGLLTLILGARALKAPLGRFFAKHADNAKIAKVEHFVMLAIDCLLEIGIAGSLQLLVYSAVIWFCEGMIFVSTAQLIGLATDKTGPWAAVSVANLSYLIPSSPGRSVPSILRSLPTLPCTERRLRRRRRLPSWFTPGCSFRSPARGLDLPHSPREASGAQAVDGRDRNAAFGVAISGWNQAHSNLQYAASGEIVACIAPFSSCF